MHFVYTDNMDEQKQLQLQFSSKNGYFMVPAKETLLLSEMLGSICFEFFQSKVPMIAQKIREMVVNSFNSSYSLIAFRKIMQLIKKQLDNAQMYKEYLIEMNKVVSEDQGQLDFQQYSYQHDNPDPFFQDTLNAQIHVLQNLEQFQMPSFIELNPKHDSFDTKTENTMQSDFTWSQTASKDSQHIFKFGTNRLQNFFSFSAGNFGYEIEKLELKQPNESSAQISSFEKKGLTIIECNNSLTERQIAEFRHDLKRQMHLGSKSISKGNAEGENYNYNKKNRDRVVNYKLKQRRK